MEKQETINGGHIKCRIQTHINGSRYLRATLDIRLMIFELEMKLEGHMKLHCNKKSVISIGHNAIHHDQTKHVEIDQMFIKKIKKKKKNGKWKNLFLCCFKGFSQNGCRVLHFSIA